MSRRRAGRRRTRWVVSGPERRHRDHAGMPCEADACRLRCSPCAPSPSRPSCCVCPPGREERSDRPARTSQRLGLRPCVKVTSIVRFRAAMGRHQVPSGRRSGPPARCRERPGRSLATPAARRRNGRPVAGLRPGGSPCGAAALPGRAARARRAAWLARPGWRPSGRRGRGGSSGDRPAGSIPGPPRLPRARGGAGPDGRTALRGIVRAERRHAPPVRGPRRTLRDRFARRSRGGPKARGVARILAGPAREGGRHERDPRRGRRLAMPCRAADDPRPKPHRSAKRLSEGTPAAARRGGRSGRRPGGRRTGRTGGPRGGPRAPHGRRWPRPAAALARPGRTGGGRGALARAADPPVAERIPGGRGRDAGRLGTVSRHAKRAGLLPSPIRPAAAVGTSCGASARLTQSWLRTTSRRPRVAFFPFQIDFKAIVHCSRHELRFSESRDSRPDPS